MSKIARPGRVLLFTLAMVLALPTPSYAAANLRGRIVRAGASGEYPVAGVLVRVFRQDAGWSQPSSSGQDGMYYLYNIPTGPAKVCIGSSGSPCFDIEVPQQGWFDIAPIRL
jgi:hypothetical protein